jgi:hypothetical protein
MFHQASSTFPAPDKFDANRFLGHDARAVFISCNSKDYAERMATMLNIRAEGAEGITQFDIDGKTGKRIVRESCRADRLRSAGTSDGRRRGTSRFLRSTPLNLMQKNGIPYALPQKQREPFRSPFR